MTSPSRLPAGSSKLCATPALRLLRDGAQAEGLEMYLQVLAHDAQNQPVGLHASMLERAGQTESAAALRQMGLVRGVDLGVKRLLPGSTPSELASEYESLFDRGLINSWMVSRYLLALERLGRRSELATLLDSDRLVIQTRIDLPDPAAKEPSLALAIKNEVLRREHLATFERKEQSVRNMYSLTALHEIASDAFDTLIAAIRVQVSDLIDNWTPVDHSIGCWLPQAYKISMWALTSRGDGFNSRHVHHRGWYTGVYYATGLDDADSMGGMLHIGRPDEVDQQAPGWPDICVRPEPGLLVLMPSYFTHWTLPLGKPGLRVSLPFDVLDHREV